MPAIDSEILTTPPPPTFEEAVLTAVYEQWRASWGKNEETIDRELSSMLTEQPPDHVETVLNAMSGYLALIALDVPDAECPLSAYQRAHQAVAATVLAGEIRPKADPESDGDTVVDLLSKRALEAANTFTPETAQVAEAPGRPAPRRAPRPSPHQTDHAFGNYLRVYSLLLNKGYDAEKIMPRISDDVIAVMLGQAPKEPPM